MCSLQKELSWRKSSYNSCKMWMQGCAVERRQTSKWSQTSIKPQTTVQASFSPFLQTFSVSPLKSVDSLTIKNYMQTINNPSCPAHAPSGVLGFANKTLQFGLNRRLGLALQILYKLLSHSSEMPWHQCTPRLRWVIDPTFLRNIFKKEEKSPKFLVVLSVELRTTPKKVKESRSRRQTFLRVVKWPSWTEKIPAWALCSIVGNIYFKKMFLSFIMS